MSVDADVIIVGCGPVGLVLALQLAQAGHQVALVERHKALYPLPRAIAFDHEIARILDGIGLMEVMQPYLASPGTYQWRNGASQLLFELVWNGEGLSGFRHSYLFSQPELEAVLNDAAQAEPRIRFHRGVEVRRVEQDGEGVTIHGDYWEEDGREVSLRGRYLVGADGANSVVRQSMGAELVDLGFTADWLVVDILPASADSALPLDDDLMLQVCDPRRPTTVVSGGPGRRRWEFMALAGETLEQLNCENKAWELLEPWGVTPDNGRLERHAVYRFRGAVGSRWRDRRVFIAGDAAHLTPPFAGQGLCAGLRDAAALCWRLHVALQGQASEAMLDSYESERRPHAEAWVRNAIELGEVICVLNPEAAAGRDQHLLSAREANAAPPSAATLPRLGDGMLMPQEAAGHLAAGGKVIVGGKEGSLDDLVGRGFVLLSLRSDPLDALSPAMRDFFASIGGVGAQIGPDAAVADVTGKFTDWIMSQEADTVLIRPDFYVFGAAAGDGSADNLVRSLAGYWQASLN